MHRGRPPFEPLVSCSLPAPQSRPPSCFPPRARPSARKRACLRCGFRRAGPLSVRFGANGARIFVQRWHRPEQDKSNGLPEKQRLPPPLLQLRHGAVLFPAVVRSTQRAENVHRRGVSAQISGIGSPVIRASMTSSTLKNHGDSRHSPRSSGSTTNWST